MKKQFLLITFAIAMISVSAQAQKLPEMKEVDTGAIVKASFIYNFSKLVDWPEGYKSGNFVISVMGGDNLYLELVKKYNSKQIGSQQIEIRKLNNTLKISKCHLLYIGPGYSELIPKIAEKYQNVPTLIVTDKVGSLNVGSIINMVPVDSEWMFELDIENAESKDLFIGSMLKSLAIRVQ